MFFMHPLNLLYTQKVTFVVGFSEVNTFVGVINCDLNAINDM